MSNYIDASHLAEIGEEYERFVGAYFEVVEKCVVLYPGIVLGKKDGGIDLIAIAKDKTYFIQCKNWLPSKIIRENVVSQLYGSASYYALKIPKAKNPTPLLVCTCNLSTDAKIYADKLGVELKKIDYSKKTSNDRLVLYNSDFSTDGFWSPGLHISNNHKMDLKPWVRVMVCVVQELESLPEEYKQWKPVERKPMLCGYMLDQIERKNIPVEKTISKPFVDPQSEQVVHNTNQSTVPVDQSPSMPDQAPSNPDQTPVETDQTPAKSSQPPIVSNQPVFRDEASGPYTESVFRDELDAGLPAGPRKTGHWVDQNARPPVVCRESRSKETNFDSAEKKQAVSKGFLYFLICYPLKKRIVKWVSLPIKPLLFFVASLSLTILLWVNDNFFSTLSFVITFYSFFYLAEAWRNRR